MNDQPKTEFTSHEMVGAKPPEPVPQWFLDFMEKPKPNPSTPIPDAVLDDVEQALTYAQHICQVDMGSDKINDALAALRKARGK
jgi:hypothetical protein